MCRRKQILTRLPLGWNWKLEQAQQVGMGAMGLGRILEVPTYPNVMYLGLLYLAWYLGLRVSREDAVLDGLNH